MTALLIRLWSSFTPRRYQRRMWNRQPACTLTRIPYWNHSQNATSVRTSDLSNLVVNAIGCSSGISPFQGGPSVALRRGRAYAHVGGVAAQVLSWAISALASSKSLRMTAVIATFGGLPAWQSWRYFRARSGLQAIAEIAGM